MSHLTMKKYSLDKKNNFNDIKNQHYPKNIGINILSILSRN